MQAVVFTQSLALYALVAEALRKAGWRVAWKEGEGLALADLDHVAQGEVLLWPTPFGLRAYDPKRYAFLTRQDRPETLAEGLRGRVGLGLLPGERAALWALGQGVPPEVGALARALGAPRHRARFYLKGLLNKFGLALPDLLRLARHQVQVAGLQGHPDGLARFQAEPFLHVPGQEEYQGNGPEEAPPVGQALGVQAF